MIIDEIRTAYYVEPFEPFIVRLTDGRKFAVTDRNHIALSQTGDSVAIAHGDTFARVAVSSIADLEPPKNKGRRKKSA